MEDVRVKQLDGGSFTLKMDSGWFAKNDIVELPSIALCNNKYIVTKIHKFTWWRKLLFRLGFKYHSMDLKQIK